MKPNIFTTIGIVLLCLYGFIPSYGEQANSSQASSKILLHLGKANLNVEVASTPAQQERGLMFRTKLDQNEGMIFLLPKIGIASFWMKNTLIPLSVAYLDSEGTILEIYDMKPMDTTVYWSKSKQVFYALEVNQKWFANNQIKVGDKIYPPPKTLRSTSTP